MWKTTMLKKGGFSNVKKTWDRLCRPDTRKQLCTSVSPKQTANKDWFLYFNMYDRLCRLNIKDFCEKQGSSECEIIYDYYPGYSPDRIRSRTEMEPVFVGSKVYLWGGTSASSQFEYGFRVYSFDPSASPTLRLCKGPISRLVLPKKDQIRVFDQRNRSHIPVLSIEEKIYVIDLPHIRVFDPVHQSWKDLPQLPCLPNTDFRGFGHIFCGHKIFITIDSSFDTACHDRVQGDSYIFDTREEKWEATNTIHYDIMESFKSFLEFEGFLIAVMRCYTHYEDKVIAYKLDSNGIPNWESYQVLHELPEIDSMYDYYFCLGKCDGGRIWLIVNWGDFLDCCPWDRTHLTVFQVSVSNDIEGNQTLSAKIEAEGYLDSVCCSSAFALCHHADNIESH